MKLKGLGSRAYNIMHHVHTVTGMMISLILFVIFFAGAYSLFRDEIYLWENHEARQGMPEEVDYDRLIQSLSQNYELDSHDPVRIYPARPEHPDVEIYASISNPDGTHDHVFGHVDLGTYRVEMDDEAAESKTMVSQTLFELHYLAQMSTIGMYLTGFAALFFLLATVTGVLIHWRNIFQKFYAFFIGKRWKQIWTDAHTVLGVISLPFQVMYAITGALFCLSLFLLLPSVMVMFGGDQTPVLSEIQPELGLHPDENAPLANMISLNDLTDRVKLNYPDHTMLRITATHYGYEDAVVTFEIDNNMDLMGSGSLSFRLTDGNMIEEISRVPNQRKYGDSVYALLVKLHFGTYGGLFLRIIYFLLALLTCFMIISGILIWQTARDNGRYTEKQKRFHHRITKLNLTVCLSLFPAIAILFIANKVVPMDVHGRGAFVEQIFFIFWLVMAAIGWFWDQYSRMAKNYFLIGGVLSFFVPILNGVVTGDWIWSSWSELPAVAGIDLLWLISGIVAIWAAGQITIQDQTEPKPSLVP